MNKESNEKQAAERLRRILNGNIKDNYEIKISYTSSLPVLDAPWDRAFQEKFCAGCSEESCDNCPNGKYRNNPEWWLKLQEENENKEKATEFYYKLHKCLNKAMNDKELGCHVNNIIRKLGKSIESGFTYYDQNFDLWCDYFLAHKEKQS